MEWRVTIELSGADGTRQTHEVACGGGTDPHSTFDPLGLTLDDGKALLAGVQRHLVQGRVSEYCAVRRRCPRCRRLRALKDTRTRRLNSLFGTIEVPAPRFKPCPCAVTARSTLCPASELMLDRCTPEYERTLAKMGAWLPYRRARRFLSEFFPLGAELPWHETIRRRTARVGVGIEREVVSRAKSPRPAPPSETITVSIDAGHVRTARGHNGRTFEVMAAQVSNDDGKPVLFSGVPCEADQQHTQLNGVLTGLGMTADTEVTILSDGADGPRSLGEAASTGTVFHVLDWFHLAMRVRHAAQCASGWPDATARDRRDGARFADAVEHIRWRLWHGQTARALRLIQRTLAAVESKAGQETAAARSAAKLTKALMALETYVSGLADLIIDYASARLDDEPFSTSPTEGAVQWLLHRRMGARQQMRWSPRGAHLMLQVRTAIVNGTFDADHRDMSPRRRSFRTAA
jgi:hypothetical protein